ncbi:hypothetical protein JCM21531_4315 [Acetivibrio straminisolvens JCM 21531]|uniref:Intein C-terminal splicing domain-containing protein n=1 Tax=Acetivibrio straminisolvens JCM 21531 TaxID=1294263 RepID=W4VBV8_9FIRM|nr:hypothetical protein JCM21531_4315 [Acetivibrio straminisolvens JCM 21531]
MTINGEVIKTTFEHPFYVKDVGFVEAGKLQIGDKLVDSRGNVLVVEEKKLETTDEPVKVYNFHVDDFYTYHVGNNGILVHNANASNYGKGTNKALEPQIEKKIEKALKSPELGKRLEGEVVKELGNDVVSFQKRIDLPSGRYGEIDVETSKYIIEVTTGKSSKVPGEFAKYFDSAMNPNNKGVILFAPNLKPTKIPGIEAVGVKVIQSLDELLKFIRNN